MKEFDLWIEGGSIEPGFDKAQYLGCYEGETFRDAVYNWAMNGTSDASMFFDAQYLTYFGCRIFNDEIEARKRNG